MNPPSSDSSSSSDSMPDELECEVANGAASEDMCACMSIGGDGCHIPHFRLGGDMVSTDPLNFYGRMSIIILQF